MTTATFENKALLAAPKDAQAPASATMVEVARKYGISPIKQMREMLALNFGPGTISLPEYITLGLFDPEIPMADKKTYVGIRSSQKVNRDMSPADLVGSRFFLEDKVMYTALLRQLGIPTTQTQAVASPDRLFGAIPALRDPAAVQRFLREDARFPVFAKPCSGFGSHGSASLHGLDGDELILGNGRKVDLEAFSHEIFRDYPDGFVFQTALQQHQTLSNVAGPAVGTLRVVTVRDSPDPQVLYTVWKMPAPDAMSDNYWQDGSIVAAVDEGGRLGRCHTGSGLTSRWIDRHPVSGAEFAGLQIPHWDEIQKMARDGHALFPEFGIVGWDIAVTPDGPTVIECNDIPYHGLYQLAFGRGFCNPISSQ